jgi:hypothetical protein
VDQNFLSNDDGASLFDPTAWSEDETGFEERDQSEVNDSDASEVSEDHQLTDWVESEEEFSDGELEGQMQETDQEGEREDEELELQLQQDEQLARQLSEEPERGSGREVYIQTRTHGKR